MNRLITEKMINRSRLVFVLFVTLAGISSWRGGSDPMVYGSIFAATGLYLLLTIVNLAAIRLNKVTASLIYTTVTFEVLLIFTVKYAFHFDAESGYGMTIKEPATFLVYFLFGIMNGLRYDKRINIYYGTLAASSYVVLVLLAVFEGGMVFSTDQTMVFSAGHLRASHEVSKVLFLLFFTYFLQLMADFTTKNVASLEAARAEADANNATISGLLKTAGSTAADLIEGNNELSEATGNIGSVIDETNRLVKEITEITGKFSRGISEIRVKINSQNDSIEKNFDILKDTASITQQIYTGSMKQKKLAENALDLAVVNENRIQSSAESIRKMQENSRKIEEISSAINDISDQTNLLALNAAIESARAGDSGRGFAVVADEITKLAGRSSDSAKEISIIIKNTVKVIDEVSSSVEGLSGGLGEIISFVRNESEFVDRLSGQAETENSNSLLLTESNREVDRNTKEVIDYFNAQTELILQIMEWMEKITGMTERMSEHLNRLMILSHTLSSRSAQVEDVIAELDGAGVQ
jgi:methyl-accepting chemotaxis protein